MSTGQVTNADPARGGAMQLDVQHIADPVDQTLPICCLGAGRAGLFSMAVMAMHNPQASITIVDTDVDLIRGWKRGDVIFSEPDFGPLLHQVRGINLHFSEEIDEAINASSIIFIAVNAPCKAKGARPNSLEVSAWQEALNIIMRACTPTTTPKIVVEKTTLPMDCDDDTTRILARSPTTSAFPVFVNPDFFSQGTAIHDLHHPARVVITKKSNEGDAAVLVNLYARWVPIEKILIVNNYKSAALGKMYTNAFLALKLMFMNTMERLCDAEKADFDDVKRIMATDDRISDRYMDPSFGIGGPGLLKDTKYLQQLLSLGLELHTEATLFDTIIKLNANFKQKFVEKILKRMGALRGKKIAVLGFSYKKGTDDVRESPAIEVCKSLSTKECSQVRIFDPRATRQQIMKCFTVKDRNVTVCSTKREAWIGANAALFLVDWEEFHTVSFQDMYHEMAKPAFVFVGCKTADQHIQSMKDAGFKLYVIGKPRHDME